MEILPLPHVTHPGLLIAIGGAEDKTRERVILRYFLEAAGGSDANIVVLATASEVPETGERYADLFYELHAETVEVLRIDTREDALEADPEALDLLEYATGLFMTGGSQLKFSSALGGTAIADDHPAPPPAGHGRGRHQRRRRGPLRAHDRAGRQRRHAAPPPRPDGQGARPRAGPRHRPALPAPRPPRPAAHRPLLQPRRRSGVGIDEDTAAIIDGDGPLRVLGAGAVTVVDASGLRYTDSHAVHRGQPIAMLGLKLDFLTAGCRYDLKSRVGIAPPPMLHLTDSMDRRAPERPPVMTEPEEVPVGSEDGGE